MRLAVVCGNRVKRVQERGESWNDIVKARFAQSRSVYPVVKAQPDHRPRLKKKYRGNPARGSFAQRFIRRVFSVTLSQWLVFPAGFGGGPSGFCSALWLSQAVCFRFPFSTMSFHKRALSCFDFSYTATWNTNFVFAMNKVTEVEIVDPA